MCHLQLLHTFGILKKITEIKHSQSKFKNGRVYLKALYSNCKQNHLKGSVVLPLFHRLI